MKIKIGKDNIYSSQITTIFIRLNNHVTIAHIKQKHQVIFSSINSQSLYSWSFKLQGRKTKTKSKYSGMVFRSINSKDKVVDFFTLAYKQTK